jgi:hypothetical protein
VSNWWAYGPQYSTQLKIGHGSAGAATVDDVDSGRRDTPLTWGFVAVFCLGTVLFVFVTTDSAAGRTASGAAASVGVLIAALLVTMIGAAVAFASTASTASTVWRWVVVSAVAVVWGAVCFLAGASLFGSSHAPDFLTGMLLAVGAVGMAGVLARLVRTLR